MMEKQLLIAEDCPILLDLLTEMFRYEGYQVSAVLDGQEAIASISERVPDIAILDVNMPLISGYEVLDFLRNQPEGHQTKVFILTGDYRVYRREEADLADVVLSKPFDWDYMLRLM